MKHAAPGALYTDTCPCHTAAKQEKCTQDGKEESSCPCCQLPGDCDKVRVFEIALVQAKITYNKYGWHDPEGRFFVLKEDLEKHGGLETYIRKVEE